MALNAILLGIVAADFIYHRWFTDDPPVAPPDKIQIPSAQPGNVVPMVWGRYRINKPLLAWAGTPHAVLATDLGFTPFVATSGYYYFLDQFFNIAIGFEGGNSRCKAVWAGDFELKSTGADDDPGPAVLPGDGTGGDPAPYAGAVLLGNQYADTPPDVIIGYFEFLNGAPDQKLRTDDGLTGLRWAGQAMIDAGVNGTLIPGYRGYLSAMLFDRSSPPLGHWCMGNSASVPPISFEIATYAAPSRSFGPDISDFFGEGIDSNPINIIYDILTGRFGKLRIETDRIDSASFHAAGHTLWTEAMGYSMAYEDGTSAGDIINDILRQIDAVLYEDPRDGKIYIKLIRADYNPNTVRELRPDTGCIRIENFAIAGWTGLPNKITVSFVSRVKGYVTDTVSGMGDANAAAVQDTEVSERLLSYSGCCTGLIAQKIADREVKANCRPIARCTAICDQSWGDVTPGMVLALTSPKLGLDRIFMRVAGITHATPSEGNVSILLVQDFSQVYRGEHTDLGNIGSSFHSPRFD